MASRIGGQSSPAIDHYVAVLKRMHTNTGQIQEVEGCTDNPDQYKKLSLRRFNRLWPLDRYDAGAMLPTIRAVEFWGELSRLADESTESIVESSAARHP